MADARRQLRSGTVVLGGVGLLAAALTSCSSDPDKRCVDSDSYQAAKGYKVVADKNCKTGSSGSSKSRKTGKVAVDGDWYYGGKEKNGWVDGGSFTKSSGSGGSSDDDDDVHRGGFGSGHGSSGG
ncbi:hypothetical protein ABT009_14290 [Streptomyces sp. NPDC002896]|uniref:hypothetical protein n=1 Tax=Streptomyces sp. NPDC002896 TaxID=3154438 RepID=UPI00331A2D4B